MWPGSAGIGAVVSAEFILGVPPPLPSDGRVSRPPFGGQASHSLRTGTSLIHLLFPWIRLIPSAKMESWQDDESMGRKQVV